ncbi:unnamed protein product, partial [Brassica oleracea var. botrytis]
MSNQQLSRLISLQQDDLYLLDLNKTNIGEAQLALYITARPNRS